MLMLPMTIDGSLVSAERTFDVINPATEEVINRDPRVFVDPVTFDIDREPNSHMAFGFGPHVCLGIHLARLERVVAGEAPAPRCPDLDLAVEPGELRGVTSPESLPVRVGSEARS